MTNVRVTTAAQLIARLADPRRTFYFCCDHCEPCTSEFSFRGHPAPCSHVATEGINRGFKDCVLGQTPSDEVTG